MAAEPLSGGFVNEVLRVGDTVRRVPAARVEFVHRLLVHFGRHGWPGAPRFHGLDGEGREILTYLDGHVPWRPSDVDGVSSGAALAGVARLTREFHDLTAGTDLAGDAEVVCHNDLSPKNTVYRDAGEGLRPVAFIDWDIAAPGERIHDLAHVCWQYVGLGPAVRDAAEAGRRMRVAVDAYGPGTDRARVVETVLWWQDRCWRGIDAAARAGEPAMVALRDRGVVGEVRDAHAWTAAHRDVLEAALDV